VVTDPPWITSSVNITSRLKGVAKTYNPTTSMEYGFIGEWKEDAISEILRITKNDVFIISGYKEMPRLLPLCDPLRGIFVWHKTNGMLPLMYPARIDVAFVVWTGRHSTLYGKEIWKSMVWTHANPVAGCFATERILEQNSGKAAHPCQGPLSLYMRIVSALPDGCTILDPFMGSGTTGVACVQTGRSFIGFEIDKGYFEIAKRRIEEAQLQTRMAI